MKILITGIAGFIGSHIADKYIELGHKIIGIDNLSTGKLENVNPKVKFYNCDINDVNKLKEIIEANPTIKVINHHAAQVRISKSIEDPGFDANVNIIGTINLLSMCKKYNIDRFIFASSSAVYAEKDSGYLNETDSTSPINCYGFSKMVCEDYISFYQRNVYPELDYIIFRYGNVFGNRQLEDDESGVIAIFLNKIKDNKSFTIFGGDQTRDFVYIKDVVNANILGLNWNTCNQIFNIGTGKETSVRELQIYLESILQQRLEVFQTKSRQREIKRIYLDIYKAKTHLKYSPIHNLYDSLRELCELKGLI